MKKNMIFKFILLVIINLSSVSHAETFDDPPPIDPPPAPIDGALVYLFVGAVLLAVYFVYRSNLKIEKK